MDMDKNCHPFTIKEFINNWQIASISKKKKKNCLKNTG